MKSFDGYGLYRAALLRITLFKDADDLAEIKSVGTSKNGSAVLGRLQNIMAASGNQAAAHKGDVRQFINCGQFANAIQQENAAAYGLRRLPNATALQGKPLY